MGFSTTASQFHPFRPLYPSSLKLLHPCPCFSSSRHPLPRFWVEPSGLVVNLPGRDEKRRLTSINYATACSLETVPKLVGGSKRSWHQEAQRLHKDRPQQKSKILPDYNMGNTRVKNEIAEDSSDYVVSGNARVTNSIAKEGSRYTVVNKSKIANPKVVPKQGSENERLERARAIAADYMNNQAIDRVMLNGSSVPKSLKLDAQTDTLSTVKILENEKGRHCNEIEDVGVNQTDHMLTNGKIATISDAKKSSNTKEATNPPDVRTRLTSIYGNILVVNDVLMADKVVSKLTNEYRHLVHACDTEVAKIDVKQETPIDHGEVICFSIYSGPDADFGDGKSCIWVDVLDGGGRDLLVKFRPFFENPEIKKVWHNYSFDKHVIQNYGFPVCGFYADTMHMARLWNSSRRTEGGYSLEALTGDKKIMSEVRSCFAELIGKVSMKTIFGKNKLKKDGSEGKMITIAPVEELQRKEQNLWICYSALDAISTWQLYESLKRKLFRMPWKLNGKQLSKSMFDFYMEYWRPFGELLVGMETEGILVDRPYLAEIEKVAKAEQKSAVNRFRSWACKYCPDAKYMNVGSDTQLRQLFFGGVANSKDSVEIPPIEKKIKVPNVDNVIEEGKKAPKKFRTISLCRIGEFPAEIYTASGWPSVSGNALKILAGKVSAEYDFMDDSVEDGFETINGSDTEVVPVFKDVDTSAYGTALKAFPSKEEGIEACHAIASLCEVCSIDSLISNFILPLQGSNVSGKEGRVHCSLNINTETGRLSARRPNLQNQPALEKDRYKIRQAFVAAPGNSLIVADYGQLELRILAHLANCKSMLEAFKAGGDFHSRTAMNMYQHIRDAVDEGEVILEWYPQPGEEKPPVPLLKDAFGAERRKAKMLNFSIAYGKTPMGLARDWKVSVEEAQETVDLWYKERQEVLQWQETRKREARKDGRVHTLLGRARVFPSLANASNAQKRHIERAAINTPVQGSAADVAMCAMLQISRNQRLQKLGWKLLLQIHDEVILEGPSESAEVAKDIVVECMSKPFFDGVNFLKVDLSVDAKCAQNWYSAK
ncbi:DNA polymerase I A, chloroplastic/mitochondrial [Mercurialis annua]|uniref:DNA polymerase I A, chloroplastic/mitochondrial n=1 Tax=Mercurialis annua TaxID=3986 RepID=UPI00215F285E|nr:DNA polymerase I A, chloroplastic/mitochondrial [Mercurialis annua]